MIEPVSADNLDEVLPLIREYQAFYKSADISDKKNREFFSQFGISNPAGCQFLFRKEGAAVGFATVYFSYGSLVVDKVAVLNDLYTLPRMRGAGIGWLLIEHCWVFAKSRGAARLQWSTALDNEPAQKLYDSMGAAKGTRHFYTYKT